MPVASAAPIRRPAAVLLAVTLVAALAACVDSTVPPPASPTPTPSTTTTPSPSATPTSTPPADAEPLDLTCGELVSPDAVYDFNPTFGLLDDFTPQAGTAGADAIAAGGLACRWVLESGGGTMDVVAAALPADRIDELKNAAFAASEMVPTYGEEAYFAVDEATGLGTAIVFEGRFWLVVSSPLFAEPGEPTGIIESALSSLTAIPAP